MTAPMVVTSWIGLQYFASAVDNKAFGSGSKVIHDVVGQFGSLRGTVGTCGLACPGRLFTMAPNCSTSRCGSPSSSMPAENALPPFSIGTQASGISSPTTGFGSWSRMQERATAGRPRLAGNCSDGSGRRVLRGPLPTILMTSSAR